VPPIVNKKPTNDTPSIILVEPQLGENIGTAARAMANFGLRDLHIVSPRDGWPNEKAKSASANAISVIENAVLHQSLEDAIKDFHIIFATTARPREMVKEIISPENAAIEMHQNIKNQRKIAILFGCEKSGLTNTDLSFSDKIIIAPVASECASLNLAQAVLLIANEWYRASNKLTLGRKTAFDGPAIEGTRFKGTHPATKDDLITLFNHLQCELEESGFFRIEEKTPQMMRNIRNMITRMPLTAQDVRTIRGMITSLVSSRKKSDRN